MQNPDILSVPDCHYREHTPATTLNHTVCYQEETTICAEYTMDDHQSKSDIEKRVRMLEERLSHVEEIPALKISSLHPAWAIILAAASIALGYLALGYPQHYYQVLFSGLLLLLLYHRGFLRMARSHWRWPQVALNFLLLCLFFKFLIGGGISHPFDWLKMPMITKIPPPSDPSWYSSFVPDYAIQWQSIPKVSEWSIDITKIQTVLFLATLSGALFRFEPFTSITALALLIISLPTYLQFNWDWVVLFLIFGSVSLYIQSRANSPGRHGGY